MITLKPKGRAGYGASLDGMVKLSYHAAFLLSETASVALQL
jgi:hypothetical protein